MPDDTTSLVATVLDTVSRFVRTLDEATLRDLVAGYRTLVLAETHGLLGAGREERGVPSAGSAERRIAGRRRSPSAAVIDDVQVRARLAEMRDREEARKYVAALGTVGALRQLANILGVRGVSKDPKPEVVRKIVDATVGVRLSQLAMRDELRSR